MPGFGDEVLEASGGEFAPYDGPLPPKGTKLAGVIKQFKLKINRNNDPMLNMVVEVSGNTGEKAKYNGLGMWTNINVTEKSAGFVNDFLTTLAAWHKKDPKKLIRSFWQAGPNVADAKPGVGGTPIIAIGDLKINHDGMPALVTTRLGTEQDKKTPKAEVGYWLMPPKDNDDSEDEVGEVEEEDGVEVEYVEDEEEVEETDEGSSGGPRDDKDDEEFSKEPPF